MLFFDTTAHHSHFSWANLRGMATLRPRQQPLEAALGIFVRMYVDTSPPWQRFWHERRLRGTPTTVIANAFCACYEGVDGIGHRSVGETYLGRRKCPILSVHSGANAALVLHQESPEMFAALTRAWLAGIPR